MTPLAFLDCLLAVAVVIGIVLMFMEAAEHA
jgi:hypothetical protein